MRNLSEAVKVAEAWETFVKQKYGNNNSGKETNDFRDYKLAEELQPTVANFYKENHRKQTMEHVKKKKAKYDGLTHGEMGIWEALELLNTLVDESDPDTQMTQIMHSLQSAEAARRDNQPRWMILTALIHDLGKYLFFLGEPQWTVVGDTFPVGCQFSKEIVYSKYFDENPDSKNSDFTSQLGIYTPHCGLHNVYMSYGHDEYLYHVVKDYLPAEAAFIIRFHSFYSCHSAGQYSWLLNNSDIEMMKWVKVFNQYDLYSKAEKEPDVDALKPFYLDLIQEFFPHKIKCFIQLPEKYKHLTAREYLEELLIFYHQYFWLIHVLPFNFITHRQWEQFDVQWREAIMTRLDQAGDEWAMAVLDLTVETSDYSIWPGSLRNYLEKARDLALPRNVNDNNSKREISKHILGGMSNKKVHEVEWMSQLIKKVADTKGINSVIDLGSGQGYLSRALAYDHGMNVVAVDMSEVQTKGALRFDKRAEKQKKDREQTVNLKHVTEKVTAENLSHVLASIDEDDDKKWLLTGLHTCGDLSPFIFRLFSESEKIACMVNVGCCYNALTTFGFPMSQVLIEKNMALKSTARVLSCHSPSRWIEEGEQCIKAFDNYFYRGLLQEMLVERGLSDVNDPPILGRIKQNKEFPSFVTAALKRLKLPVDTITEQEAKDHLLKAKEKQDDKHFVVLWTLRALLAPIVESIILVDRWLYLEESINSTSSVQAYPLFDLSESPRNIVYVANKK